MEDTPHELRTVGASSGNKHVHDITGDAIRASPVSNNRVQTENAHPNYTLPKASTASSLRRPGHSIMNPTPPPPPSSQASGARSSEELRRSSLNMEKMIKKNVLAASRPGGMKRGLAVVEYFKQQQQQQQQQGEAEGDAVAGSGLGQAPAKRKKENPAASILRASASALIGPPTSSVVPKSVTPSAPPVSHATATLLPPPAAAQRSSPLRQAFTSPSRRQVYASPSRRQILASPSRRQVFTSPSRRLTTTTLPLTEAPPLSRAVAAPVLNLDQVDAAATPLKPPVLPSKSPFQSFQTKLVQSRQSPSPVRPTPPLPRRLAVPAPVLEAKAEEVTTSTVARSPVVDLTHTPEPAVTLPLKATTANTTTVPPVSSAVTPPPKPLARSLFSSASASVAAKSLCFSTESVASSIDVSPDGECIVVAFTDGSVRLYEMDSTVPSDRHGFLLGHLDEESNQSSAGAHLRVKISSDGRFAFVGCRSGPRVMMSIHLHNYRNGKDTEDDEMDQLQKSFHSNTRLRGFSDVTKCLPTENAASPSSDNVHSYYLLCGLGIGTLHMWQFIENGSHRDSLEWKQLYSIAANGNTAMIASFLPSDSVSKLQIAAKCEDKNMRVWNLEPTTNADGMTCHTVKGQYDLPTTKDVIAFYGSYAYGIAPTGEACRFRIPAEPVNPARTVFEMEQLDMGGSASKSRRSTIILESIFASDDGQAVVAVSAEGIFYYTREAGDGNMGGILRIIGRNSSLNAQFKTPMKVYKPTAATGGLQNAVMAAVTNPQHDDDGEEGYLNVDLTEAWAARWMVPSQGKDCWVCGVRNLCHWQTSPDATQVRTEKTAVTRAVPGQPAAPVRKSRGEAGPHAKSPSKNGAVMYKTTVSATQASPEQAASGTHRSEPAAYAKSVSAQSIEGTKRKRNPAPVKRLDAESMAWLEEEEKVESRHQHDQLVLELARYKERYNQIVTEWQRRLKGERQMRRMWKQRETEFEGQLLEATTSLDTAEQEIIKLKEMQKDAEKRFIFEKLKAEQQSSVKIRYEQLCEQMQERMVALEHQQRVMEQTSRALLQEVDRQVQHSKQSVNGLVDRQQNECILCKDSSAVTAIVPCGHLCFCENDAEVYRRNFRGGDQVTCPICQREMISMLRIY